MDNPLATQWTRCHKRGWTHLPTLKQRKQALKTGRLEFESLQLTRGRPLLLRRHFENGRNCTDNGTHRTHSKIAAITALEYESNSVEQIFIRGSPRTKHPARHGSWDHKTK